VYLSYYNDKHGFRKAAAVEQLIADVKKMLTVVAVLLIMNSSIATSCLTVTVVKAEALRFGWSNLTG